MTEAPSLRSLRNTQGDDRDTPYLQTVYREIENFNFVYHSELFCTEVCTPDHKLKLPLLQVDIRPSCPQVLPRHPVLSYCARKVILRFG